jgi:HK97 family phage prohead protease
MPEETEDFIHIPVRNSKDFKEGSYRTITLSATKNVKAVIGKLKEDDGNTHVQKYLFDKSKGWTMGKAKKWIKKKKSEKDSFDVGLSKTEINLLMPMKATSQTTNFGNRVIEGYATMGSFNRNGYHVTNNAFSDTLDEFMENPVLLFMHMPWLVIGSVLQLKIDKQGVFVKAELLPEGKSELADEAWNAIENGSLKAFSIGFLVLAYEKVCMEKDLCFFSVTEGELIELSVVSVPAVRGSYFKIKDNEKEKQNTNSILNINGTDYTLTLPIVTLSDDGFDWDISTADNPCWTDTGTTSNPLWSIDTGTTANDVIEYNIDLDDNIKVTQIIDDNSNKVKTMEEQTPEPSVTEEVAGEDLSSTENSDEMLAKLNEVLDFKKALEAEQEKLKEQNLDLQVKKTMTLFEGVENKADIETHVATVAKSGGEDALTAMKEILKSVMESKVIVDNKLTLSGGVELKHEDELSMKDYGKSVDEMVADITQAKPLIHEIKLKVGE